MTVVQITNDVAEASGVGTFVRRANAALCARGVSSEIVTVAGGGSSAVREWTEEFTSNLSSGQLIFHIHGIWLALQRAAVRLACERGIPIVWSTHGMTAPWAMRHKWWKKLPAWWLYQKRDLKTAAAIHCTTDLEVSWNQDLGFTNTFVVPLGTTAPTIQSSAPSLDPHPHTLLFVGRINPVKALDNLIRAFARAGVPGWKLRLVGPDECGHTEELKSLAAQLGLQDRVEFAGPKYGSALEEEYAAADLFALVSHTENFGATVVDALAHGRCVITSTATPWRIVAEAGCGWWVENAPETLARTLTEAMGLSDEARVEKGARGRKLVEKDYTWEAVAARLESVYRQVMKGV